MTAEKTWLERRREALASKEAARYEAEAVQISETTAKEVAEFTEAANKLVDGEDVTGGPDDPVE